MATQRMLGGLFFLLGLGKLVQAGMTWIVSPALSGISLAIPLPLLGVIYLGWGVGLLGLAFQFWRGRAFAWALPSALLFQSTVWIIRLLGDRSAYARQAWGREAVFSLIFLAAVGILTIRLKRTL